MGLNQYFNKSAFMLFGLVAVGARYLPFNFTAPLTFGHLGWKATGAAVVAQLGISLWQIGWEYLLSKETSGSGKKVAIQDSQMMSVMTMIFSLLFSSALQVMIQPIASITFNLLWILTQGALPVWLMNTIVIGAIPLATGFAMWKLATLNQDAASVHQYVREMKLVDWIYASAMLMSGVGAGLMMRRMPTMSINDFYRLSPFVYRWARKLNSHVIAPFTSRVRLSVVSDIFRTVLTLGWGVSRGFFPPARKTPLLFIPDKPTDGDYDPSLAAKRVDLEALKNANLAANQIQPGASRAQPGMSSSSSNHS